MKFIFAMIAFFMFVSADNRLEAIVCLLAVFILVSLDHPNEKV